MLYQQKTFSNLKQEGKRRQTRREKFLSEMERIVPWGSLVALIEPFYPKGVRGRPSMGLERMLRLYKGRKWLLFFLSAIRKTIASYNEIAIGDDKLW